MVIEFPASEKAMTPAEKRHLASLEKRIAAGLQTFREVGAALLEIRDSGLYRESHNSFEAYCAEKWGMNRVRAYQLIDSAKVVNVLGDPKELTNEAQARELAPLTDDPDTAKKVWNAVSARARETSRPVTAGLIRQVRGEVLPATGVMSDTPAPTPTDRLLQDITRLQSTWQRWKDSRPNVGERNKVNAALKRFTEAVVA